MTFTHTNRKGVTYYLRRSTTKTGKARYTFARSPGLNAVDALPEGYMVRESVNGQVSLAKARPRLITEDEERGLRALVEAICPRCRVEVRGAALTVFEGVDSMTDLGALLQRIAPSMDVGAALGRVGDRTRYEPVLRFDVLDPESRVFGVSRMMYRGEPDWWLLDDGALLDLGRAYLPHIGEDSFFDLE